VRSAGLILDVIIVVGGGGLKSSPSYGMPVQTLPQSVILRGLGDTPADRAVLEKAIAMLRRAGPREWPHVMLAKPVAGGFEAKYDAARVGKGMPPQPVSAQQWVAAMEAKGDLGNGVRVQRVGGSTWAWYFHSRDHMQVHYSLPPLTRVANLACMIAGLQSRPGQRPKLCLPLQDGRKPHR
jgi:hypothetical protein